MKTSEREVTPQWAKGGLNLGVYTVNTVEFDEEGLLKAIGAVRREYDTESDDEDFAKEERDAKAADNRRGQTITRLLNGAIHINGSSEFIKAMVTVRDKGEKEKQADYLEATRDDAMAQVAKLHAAGQLKLDFSDLLDFIMERERDSAASDPVVKLIREKWEASTKKDMFLERYKLDASLAKASTEEVVKAYLASKSGINNLL